MNKGIPELVAEAVPKIISRKTPRLRYLLGPQEKSSSLKDYMSRETEYFRAGQNQ